MASKQANQRTKRNIAARKRLWPDLKANMVWSFKKSDGYAPVPRTMPIFFIIMDSLSKSKPLSSTYFALWCRCWDQSGYVKVISSTVLAEESGFTGQRAVSTWRTRIKILERLGFIKIAQNRSEPYGHVALMNPYKVVKQLRKQGDSIDEGWFNALRDRAEEIKATDLDDDEE